MECPQEARAHRAGVQGVQGGDGGVGAAHHAQVMRHICTIYKPLLTIPCVSVIINKTLKLKTDPVQLGDAPHGVLHQPPRHPADASLPELAPSLEKNPCKGLWLFFIQSCIQNINFRRRHRLVLKIQRRRERHRSQRRKANQR